jgi:hypothetical protein
MNLTIKHAHDGYSCWTPKLCTALNAIAELRTLAVRQDDHELSVRLDLLEEILKGEPDRTARCVDCDAPATAPSQGHGAPEGQRGPKCSRHTAPRSTP